MSAALTNAIWPAKWLSVQATGFMLNFTNQIVQAAATGPGGTNEVNGGATQHLGVEGALVFALGDALRLPIGVDITERYTFARAVFSAGLFNHKILPYSPLHTSSATLDLTHRLGLGFQATWLHVSSQFSDQNDSVAENAPMHQHCLLPATAAYPLNPARVASFIKLPSSAGRYFGVGIIKYRIRYDFPTLPQRNKHCE